MSRLFRPRVFRFGLSMMATLTCLAGLFSVQPVVAQGDPLQLYIRVVDGEGTPVLDLTSAEVVVQQGGQSCEIIEMQGEPDGMKIAVLVDTNAPPQWLNPYRDGLAGFFEALPDNHEVGIFTITGQTTQRVEFTRDHSELANFAEDIFMDPRATVMLDGLAETWRTRFEEDDGWPVVVMLLHDGPDGSSLGGDENQRTVTEMMQRGATVHTLVFASGSVDQLTQVSRNVVQNTGGIHSRIQVANALEEALTDLGNQISAHYQNFGNSYRVVFQCETEGDVGVGVGRAGTTFTAFGSRRVD